MRKREITNAKGKRLVIQPEILRSEESRYDHHFGTKGHVVRREMKRFRTPNSTLVSLCVKNKIAMY